MTEGIELLNQEQIRKLGDKLTTKHLEIYESDTIKMRR